MNLFNEHGPDCTPLVPCAACEIVAWLKEKLDPEDFTELVERMNALDQPKRGRPRRTAKFPPALAEAVKP